VQGRKLWYIPLVFARRCCSMCYCSSRSISKSIREVYFIWVTTRFLNQSLGESILLSWGYFHSSGQWNKFGWWYNVFRNESSCSSFGATVWSVGLQTLILRKFTCIIFTATVGFYSKLDGPYISFLFLGFLNLMLFGSISMFFSTHLKSQ